jgi:hypothetical protein
MGGSLEKQTTPVVPGVGNTAAVGQDGAVTPYSKAVRTQVPLEFQNALLSGYAVTSARVKVNLVDGYFVGIKEEQNALDYYAREYNKRGWGAVPIDKQVFAPVKVSGTTFVRPSADLGVVVLLYPLNAIPGANTYFQGFKPDDLLMLVVNVST